MEVRAEVVERPSDSRRSLESSRLDQVHSYAGEVTVLAVAILTCALYYFAGSARPLVLFLFFLPVIVSALTLGRYRACLVTALCLAFVVCCGPEGLAPQLAGLNMAIWAAVLSLTAVLTGGLRDEKHMALRALQEKSQAETFTDALTQIANRRAFDYELGRRFAEYRRRREDMAMALFDVDRFKGFNDRFGHPAGDAILKQLAAVLKGNVRAADLVARYGGEEFALILPQTHSQEARWIAEKVRRAVEAHWFEFGESQYRITVSVGVSNIAYGDDIAQLTRRTDAALYASKQSGRNCAHYHDGERVVAFGDRLPTTDIEESKEKRRTESSSYLDAHSGLPHCEVFTHELTRRVAEAHRYDGELSVMLARVIPAIPEPDQEAIAMMQSVTAECIRNLLRIPDLGTRYRTMEFAILLPSTDLDRALIPALRLRELVDKCQKPMYQGAELHFRVAIGVAQVIKNEQPGPLMKRISRAAEEAVHAPWAVVSDPIGSAEVDRQADLLNMTLPEQDASWGG